MSNNKEENRNELDPGFFENMKKLREQNEANIEAINAWEQDRGPKPTREMMPEILTEQQLHDKAKEVTQRQYDEQAYLEKSGLVQDQPQRRSFADKQRDNRGSEAIEQAREEQRQEQSLEQQHKLEQKP